MLAFTVFRSSNDKLQKSHRASRRFWLSKPRKVGGTVDERTQEGAESTGSSTATPPLSTRPRPTTLFFRPTSSASSASSLPRTPSSVSLQHSHDSSEPPKRRAPSLATAPSDPFPPADLPPPPSHSSRPTSAAPSPPTLKPLDSPLPRSFSPLDLPEPVSASSASSSSSSSSGEGTGGSGSRATSPCGYGAGRAQRESSSATSLSSSFLGDSGGAVWFDDETEGDDGGEGKESDAESFCCCTAVEVERVWRVRREAERLLIGEVGEVEG
ncbi:hypothetical protein JCM8097_002898 [Rhodosporidiobolus ruineniae]